MTLWLSFAVLIKMIRFRVMAEHWKSGYFSVMKYFGFIILTLSVITLQLIMTVGFYRQHTLKKIKKHDIRFTSKITRFQSWTLEKQKWTYVSLNVHQFCKSKCSCFMRETDFIFHAFFNVVYDLFIIHYKCTTYWMNCSYFL